MNQFYNTVHPHGWPENSLLFHSQFLSFPHFITLTNSLLVSLSLSHTHMDNLIHSLANARTHARTHTRPSDLCTNAQFIHFQMGSSCLRFIGLWSRTFKGRNRVGGESAKRQKMMQPKGDKKWREFDSKRKLFFFFGQKNPPKSAQTMIFVLIFSSFTHFPLFRGLYSTRRKLAK